MGDSIEPTSDTGDLFRILVATDCHLGYMEKDELRRDDSFSAFEEICSIAERREVDFILLGGDLFHENKPSRSTLVRTIEILRRYCLNDRPVQFQVVSDQTVNFLNMFGHVNFEDPHFNVGMPVFTIHGNHDDPAGVDNLSAIDILASCNLVNYFGKSVLAGSGVGQISLHPILLRKGSTRLALYGLGNIRDERLNRMFQTPHAVQWVRPAAQEDCSPSDWFNIFVLHQNRVKSNPKNAISEHLLARFLDFVIWGHEHECVIEPQEVAGMGFHVTQPGSSVATSLIDGEAKQKHVLLLEVKGNQYRPTKIPLNSVRPFLFADVSLKDETDLDPNDQAAVHKFLDDQVQRLIDQSTKQRASSQEPMLPLIRLRVDYTGFTTVNPQRFGQKFVGKVANPHDILLFTKAPKKRTIGERDGTEAEVMRPEELNQQSIEALVNESNLSMEILPVTELGLALHQFVSKDDKQAFHSCVKANLNDTQSKLAQEADVGSIREEGVLAQKLSRIMQHREAETVTRVGDASALGPSQGGGERAEPSSGRTSVHQASIGEAVNGKRAESEGVMGAREDNEAMEFEGPDWGGAPLGGSTHKNSRRQSSEVTATRGRGRSRGRGLPPPKTMKQSTLILQPRERPAPRAAAAAAVSMLRDAGVEDIASESDDDAADELEIEAALAAEQSEEESLRPTSGRARGKRAAPARGSRGGAPKRGRTGSSLPLRPRRIVEDDEEDPVELRNLSEGGVLSGTTSQSPRRASQGGRKWGSLRK